jgi:sporulation protein YlmC with PRC-barrel domain
MPALQSAETQVDALLLLLDRQITDVERRMVAKVDDLELTEAADGSVAISGLLCGPAALLPRLGGRFGASLHRYWVDLGRQHLHRERPQWIDLADVASLGSEIQLRVGRDGLLRTQPDDGPEGRRRRLGDLIGMRAYDETGARVGRVLDAGFDRPGIEQGRRSALVSLLVGKGRPGARFGYDRRPDMGPLLLSHLIHALQGNRGVVAADRIRSIDWELGQVQLSAGPQPVLTAGSGR